MKKEGHCFDSPGFDPNSRACASCLEYVRVKCAENKRKMVEGVPGDVPVLTESEKALASFVELNERFMDKLGEKFRKMVKMGADIKQATFFMNDKPVVFSAYSRVTGKMKVNTAKWPTGRIFEMKSIEEVDALAVETVSEV